MADTEMMGAFAPRAWAHGSGVLSLDRPRVMAIVNLTPDSFSDAGVLMRDDGTADADAAVELCRQLIRQGADILDLGGESTRPGATPVTPEHEQERVLPVLQRLMNDPAVTIPISVDTRHAAVARAAIAAGASIINDVSGLAEPHMLDVVADSEAGIVLGHLRGSPQTMQKDIRFVDLLREVTDELAERVEQAVTAGIERPRIMVDPGIGFGKSAEQSAALVAAAGWLRQATMCPVLIGASRKSFLQAIISRGAAGDRLVGSLAAAVVAVERGASVIRVHDVSETVEALSVAASIARAYERHAQAAAEGEEGWQ